jgi:ABC-type transport system involved in multi-copper enzyme maturation permease subunit
MRLLAAELLKIWTAPRTLLGIILAQTAIVLLGVITTVRSAVNNEGALPDRLATDVVSIAGTSLLFAALIGVLIATTEYRHGTITLTFLAAPVREKVLAAKTGAAVIASAVLAMAALVFSVGIAQIWVGGRNDYVFGSNEFELVGRLFLTDAFVAMIGVMIGASLKRQLGAIILILGWLFFFEPALAALLPETMDYLAGPAIGGLLGDDPSAPSFGHSLPVLAGYLAGFCAVAVVLTRRRDIS